jgi:flagellar hook-associated protein 2
MFSGIDTDSLVKAMTMQQQRKVDQLAADRTRAEWKRDKITDFNNQLRVFRDTYGSVIGSNSLMSRSAFTSFNVKMGENTGVGISASGTAKAGSYNVRVDQIATASSAQGRRLTDRAAGLTAAEVNSTAIGNLSLAGGGSFTDTIRFTVNDREFAFSANTTLKNVMDEVNRAGIGVTMAYSQTTDSITITGNNLGAYNPPVSSDFGTDAEFNAAREAYDAANAGKNISLTDSSGFLSFLGIDSVTAGRDAVVFINGEETPRHLSTNSITLDGITMDFLRPTAETGVDFTLAADFSPAVGRIRGMVDAFNNIMKEIDTAFNQKTNRDFPPLTEEQRAEMKEKEAEDWDAKAKEGILARDNVLGRLLSGMRGVLSKSFGDSGSLSSIGITTGPYRLGEPAQLQIDEEKLLEALRTDPDRVYNLFSAPARDGGQGGLMTQLNSIMDEYVNTTRGRELQTLNNSINTYSKRIKEQQDRLAAKSEQYYLQYARLETMLGQMTSQQEQMASMFGWNNN